MNQHPTQTPSPEPKPSNGQQDRSRQSMLNFARDMGDPGATYSLAVKSRLIDQIMELNPTASREFLATFSGVQLANYLSHLNLAAGPRGNTPWMRPGDAPAIVAYRPTA